MKIKINVTEENIKRGRKEHCGLCPIARALTDAGFQAVAVESGTAVRVAPHRMKRRLANYGGWMSHNFDGVTALEVRNEEQRKQIDDFIRNFDMSGKKAVKPFSFTAFISAKDYAKTNVNA